VGVPASASQSQPRSASVDSIGRICGFLRSNIQLGILAESLPFATPSRKGRLRVTAVHCVVSASPSMLATPRPGLGPSIGAKPPIEFIRGRVIDVSTEAAVALGFRQAGVAHVRIDQI
jgi:hypothetical protein